MIGLLLLACTRERLHESGDSGVLELLPEPIPCGGLGVDSTAYDVPEGSIDSTCLACEGEPGTCAWDVAVREPAVGVELEAHAALPEDDAYAEFHTGFADAAVGDVPTLRIVLAVVTDPAAYVPDASTILDDRGVEVALFTVQLSAYDALGSFTDCIAWGADVASWGGGCREP